YSRGILRDIEQSLVRIDGDGWSSRLGLVNSRIEDWQRARSALGGSAAWQRGLDALIDLRHHDSRVIPM
ncbi:hypothetical protein C8R44DRAFT_823137, partial [Mycena epipterygia]